MLILFFIFLVSLFFPVSLCSSSRFISGGTTWRDHTTKLGLLASGLLNHLTSYFKKLTHAPTRNSRLKNTNTPMCGSADSSFSVIRGGWN